MNFIEKIRTILKNNHWTQKHLAQVIGVSPARLNHWICEKNGYKAEWITEKINQLYEELKI